MIHVFIGTKAQLIKMAPILKELDNRGISYNYLDTGQHIQITERLSKQFHLRSSDVVLRKERGNINTIFQAVDWAFSTIWEIIFNKKKISEKYFRGEGGLCLIHGDTLSTLFSLFYAKRCGLRVAHVEAGLRSFHILDPFPEEIIRLIVMKFSDILFAPSDWAVSNLKEMGHDHKTIPIGGNTVFDSLRYARKLGEVPDRSGNPYVLVTIHRVETIYSKKRLDMIVALINRISSDHQVIFVLHEPTRNRLKKYNLFQKLELNQNVDLLPLQPYLQFVGLIEGADFVITDGGSIQEEAYFLNVPTLIMRTKTERRLGLGRNAILSQFDPEIIDIFLKNWRSYRSSSNSVMTKPSSNLVDYLLNLEKSHR